MPKVARLPATSRAPLPERAQHPRVPPRSHARYFAFLSYSHKDEEIATWLHRELERFRVPASRQGRLTATESFPRRLRPIFRDEQELAAADDSARRSRARWLLPVPRRPVFAGRRAIKVDEAEIACSSGLRPDGCVLAAIADGEPFASEIRGASRRCFRRRCGRSSIAADGRPASAPSRSQPTARSG
jgi:hypothetical protein